MGYLIFRNYSTESLTDVYVSQMPSHRKAAMRYTEYYVKGRDGALHIDEGFENFDLEVKLVLVNASIERRYEVNAWADGTGKLISSGRAYVSVNIPPHSVLPVLVKYMPDFPALLCRRRKSLAAGR